MLLVDTSFSENSGKYAAMQFLYERCLLKQMFKSIAAMSGLKDNAT